jgi:hypothetical protein
MRGMSKAKRSTNSGRKKSQGNRSGRVAKHSRRIERAGTSAWTNAEKRVFKITVHAATPTPNTWVRAHWSKYQTIKKEWLNRIYEATIENYGRGKFGPPVKNASLTVTRKGLKLLDYDNLVGGFKPLIDALTKLGYLEDDTNDVIETLSAKQERVSSRDDVQTEIIIAEI